MVIINFYVTQWREDPQIVLQKKVLRIVFIIMITKNERKKRRDK